jgi:hypothetical protein
MTEPLKPASSPNGMFSEPPREKNFPTTAVAIAAVAVVILVAVLVMLGRRDGRAMNPNVEQPLAPYASSLAISDVQMSESTSLSGGKSTYIDGKIANHGNSTVTGVTVQALFANDTSMPPQIQTVALNLIRTREPYVDTQPVSAAPIAPGGQADFRLIFENVQDNWNQKQPELHIVQVGTR